MASRSLGRPLLQDFLFDANWRNLNHGSYGTIPRSVRDALRGFQDECESRVDQFMKFKFEERLDTSRLAIAKVLNAPPETLTYVQNATTGVNTVLRNLVYEPRDHIIYFDTIYGACGNTVTYVTETTPAQATKISYDYPVSDDWLVQQLVDTIAKIRQAGEQAKVVIFDTVVSQPGVRMPFERLTKVCKDHGVFSLIDGAHGVGHVDLDLTTLDPDFFVSNCHKWLYVPRGCAVFYVPVRNQHLLRSTLPTSHGFIPLGGSGNGGSVAIPAPAAGKSDWQVNFDFIGTLDNSPYFCVPAAVAYREALGGEAAIRAHCFALAREAGRYTAAHLGTEILENAEGTLGECCFSNVRLPLDLPRLLDLARAAEQRTPGAYPHAVTPVAVGAWLRNWLGRVMVAEYDTYIQNYYYAGAMWVRLSAQTYLELDDFKWGADVLKKLCARVMEGEAFVAPSAQ